MTWKSRRRKRFFRHVKSLEETEIFLVDKYICINEYAGGPNNNNYKPEHSVRTSYKEDLKSGRVKSSLDFDDYYNPDLTFFIDFERDEKKANLIIKDAFFKIGKRWGERLKEMFPDNKYTLVMYFDAENSEWFLDIYNSSLQITDSQNPDRYTGIFYFNRR
jgi:hypothetical protein